MPPRFPTRYGLRRQWDRSAQPELHETVDWLVLLRLGLQHARPQVEQVINPATLRDTLRRITRSAGGYGSPELVRAVGRLSPFLDDETWQLCAPLMHEQPEPPVEPQRWRQGSGRARRDMSSDRMLVDRVLRDLSAEG